MLVAARFVQGIGGAMTSAVILGMIVTMFPEPGEQANAIGVYGFVASAGGSIGLLVGGVLTQSINWHWIFFVNVPIAIATAVAAMRLLDRDASLLGDGQSLDHRPLRRAARPGARRPRGRLPPPRRAAPPRTAGARLPHARLGPRRRGRRAGRAAASVAGAAALRRAQLAARLATGPSRSTC